MGRKILVMLCAVALAGCTARSVPTEKIEAVPTPQETDEINSFYRLINEKKISAAIGMMSESLAGDESQKQAWGVQFNAMKSVQVTAVEKTLASDWTEDKHVYTVALDVVMSPESARTAIPFYGYENGKNIRWVTLQKINNQWKVAEIATGP